MRLEPVTRTLEEIRERWEQRRVVGEQLSALVPLSAIVAEVLADLASLVPDGEEPLSLQEAAKESGYSVDRLQKLVASGAIPNAGRRGKPAIRRSDLPRKPSARPADLRPEESQRHFPDRRRIVASARTQPRRGA